MRGELLKDNDQFRDLLKKGNLKSTRHRNAILGVLDETDNPVSAEAIFLLLKDKRISISLSTVYRVLETLVEKGFVVRSFMADENKSVYELSHEDHRHHLVCVCCKKMLPVDGCPLEDYEKALENRFGFKVKGHKLEVFGYCEGCKSRLYNNE